MLKRAGGLSREDWRVCVLEAAGEGRAYSYSLSVGRGLQDRLGDRGPGGLLLDAQGRRSALLRASSQRTDRRTCREYRVDRGGGGRQTNMENVRYKVARAFGYVTLALLVVKTKYLVSTGPA